MQKLSWRAFYLKHNRMVNNLRKFTLNNIYWYKSMCNNALDWYH